VADIAAARALAVFNWECGGAGGASVWRLRRLLHSGATVTGAGAAGAPPNRLLSSKHLQYITWDAPTYVVWLLAIYMYSLKLFDGVPLYKYSVRSSASSTSLILRLILLLIW
jgi:hypothetical protein